MLPPVATLLVLLAACLSGIVECQKELPVFTTQPVNQTKELRESAIFQCRVQKPQNALLKATITWYKNEKKVTGFDATQHYIITSDGDLVIQGVRGDLDEGEYYCRAENVNGFVNSKKAWLIIYSMAEQFKVAPQNSSIQFGQSKLLQCEPPESHPEAKVTWFKGTEQIDTDKNSHFSLVGYNLAIQNAGTTESGYYTCVATNGHQERRSRPAAVFVGTEPYFTKELKAHYSVLQGESLTLECRASGSPTPSIYWMRGDFTKITPVSNDKYIVKRGSLQIVNLDTSDSGTYKCVATNNIKSINSQTTILVAGEQPDFLKRPPPETVVTVGETVSLPCQAMDSNTEVFWSLPHSDIPYLIKGQQEGHISVSDRGSLNIQNVLLSDKGEYRCSIVALEGADNFVATKLVVKQPTQDPPPLIQIEPFNQTVAPGSSVLLPCYAEGTSNLPTIHWTFNQRPLSDMERHLLLMNGSLHITNAHTQDSGIYTCTADNTFGDNSASARLTVTSSPTTSQRVFMHTQLPIPPNFFVVSKIGLTDVTLMWFPAYFQSRDDPISYRIDFYSDGLAKWRSVYTAAIANRNPDVAIEHTVKGLSLSAKHQFTVRSCNYIGCGRATQIHFKVELLGSVPSSNPSLRDSPSSGSSGENSNNIPHPATQFDLDLFLPTLVNSSMVMLSWRVLSHPTSVMSFTVQIDEDNPSRRQTSMNGQDSSLSGSSSSSVIHHSQVKQPPVLTEFLDRTERSFLIRGLKPAHAYNVTFNIKLTNGALITKQQTYETLQAPPSAPPEKVAAMLNGTSVQIHWVPPPPQSVNGILTGYVILVYNEKGVSLYNISVGNVTHSQMELASDRHHTIVIRVAGRTMAPGIGVMSTPITLTFGTPPSGFMWSDSYTWILAVVGALVWVLLILLAFLIMKRWFFSHRKAPPMTFRRNLLKQVYQDSNMSNITVDSEMFISTPFDHHHHLAEFHPPHHTHPHPHHPQLLKCPAAAAAATSQRNNNKDDKHKETVSFVPHYSSATVKSAKQNKQFVPLRPTSTISQTSHQTSPAITFPQPPSSNSIYENAAAREPQLIIPLQTQTCTLISSVHAPCEFGDSNPFLNMISTNCTTATSGGQVSTTSIALPNIGGTAKSSRMMQLPARPSHGFPKTVPGSSSSRSSTNSPSFVDENCRYCLRAEENPEPNPQQQPPQQQQNPTVVERESNIGSHYASVDPMFYCDNYTALELCVNGSD